MACCADPCPQSLITELKDLVHQIDHSCCQQSPEPPCQPCCQPCCTPCTVPYAEVIMTCPPPILAPTRPEPVKPLQLPCPFPCSQPEMSPEDADRFRYDNFYNHYNVDYHEDYKNRNTCPAPPQTPPKKICDDYTQQKNESCSDPGCPTGFKPCTMKLTPPPCCDPYGIWCAQIQKCLPKPKKKSNKYEPGPCTRKCCKHWKPKEGPCLYDDPCKAHCFNHPPGMKPSGRFP